MNTYNSQQLIGVEIGVYKGENAIEMLANCPALFLFLVDNYDRITKDAAGTYPYTSEEMKLVKAEAIQLLQSFNNRYMFIFKSSNEAVKEFNDLFFDYIYIDGDHRYEQIKQDLDFWYPKLKLGGIFAGHDFNEGGVNKAVNEWFINNKLQYFTEIPSYDWWSIKNE